MPFRFLEHTADIRVACEAGNLPALLECAADALYAVALHRRQAIIDLERHVSFSWSSREELVVRWLQELLFLLDTERFVAVNVHWSVGPEGNWAQAVLKGYICEPGDRAEEIKAVTYHGLDVARTPAGYRAEIVFDV